MEQERFGGEDDGEELKQFSDGDLSQVHIGERINHDREDGAGQKGDAMVYINNPRVKT